VKGDADVESLSDQLFHDRAAHALGPAGDQSDSPIIGHARRHARQDNRIRVLTTSPIHGMVCRSRTERALEALRPMLKIVGNELRNANWRRVRQDPFDAVTLPPRGREASG
jgi:hypothetical protein